MGDFKINLALKLWRQCQFDFTEFINTIVSYDFLPNILQPARITDHTATLINRWYIYIYIYMYFLKKKF